MTTRITVGTTIECLQNFGRVFKDAFKAHKCILRREFAATLKVSNISLYRWLKGHKSLPIGLNRVKLQVFLELVGYKLSDLPDREKILIELAKHLALSTVTVDQVVKATGTTEQSVLRWVTDGGVSAKNTDQISRVIDPHRDTAAKRFQVWQAFAAKFKEEKVKPAEKAPQTHASLQSQQKTNGSTHLGMIDSLAHLILAAKPLAHALLSDDFSAEDREKLRQLTQVVRDNGLFSLSNMLNRLCSERARKDIPPQD